MITDHHPDPSIVESHGGAFLLGKCASQAILTPERLSPEHVAIRAAIRAFVAREVEPRRERLEATDYTAHRELLVLLGDAGYLGVEIPERYGGAGLDHLTSTVVTEALASADALAITHAAHSGIGTLPTLLFGTESQKRRYLPGLASGAIVGAYALTEPTTGSDARAIRARAVRDEDGSYRLHGVKQFITNAGFADLFTIYARVEPAADEAHGIAAFLVDRQTPGLSVGREERKLGMHGTSTCPIALDAVLVPQDNVLGVVGEGHRIAFNVLNMGRLKLAASAIGSMRRATGLAIDYARSRIAFGRPIIEFALIAGKVAGMAARTYASESTVYRIAGLLGTANDGGGASNPTKALLASAEEYSGECSIAKVAATEDLDWVVDELVQVHGGYGYIEDYPAARAYRDARIHRIWEGTNEINRLLVPATFVRRAIAGRLDLFDAAGRARLEDTSLQGHRGPHPGPLASEIALVDNLRVVVLLLMTAAAERYESRLDEEQELLAGLADLAIAVFVAESSVLRAGQAHEAGSPAAAGHVDLARMIVAERLGPAALTASMLAAYLDDAAATRDLRPRITGLLEAAPTDRVATARRVAGRVAGTGNYQI